MQTMHRLTCSPDWNSLSSTFKEATANAAMATPCGALHCSVSEALPLIGPSEESAIASRMIWGRD
eukprot:1148881-Pelagomonas_calceolata.AAC.1